MGDSGEERDGEWGIVGKKVERVGESGEERDGEWGIVEKYRMIQCIGFPLDRSTCMCFSELCSCVRGEWCEGRGVALSSSITTTRELRKAAR